MPDESGMNITNFISASLVFGSLLVATQAALAEGGVGSVQLIELPTDRRDFGSLVFSDDGSSMGYVTDYSGQPKVHLYRDQAWRVVYQDLGIQLYSHFVQGISDDGSTLLFTDLEQSYLYRDGFVSRLPRTWLNDEGLQFAQLLQAVSLSGDGSTVSIIGKTSAVPYDDDRPLIWNSSNEELVELDIGNPADDDFGYRVVDLSGNGRVVAVNAAETGPINNLRNGPTAKVYLWVAGNIIQIPQPAHDLELSMWAYAVSGDGDTVVGLANAPYRDENPFGLPYGHVNSAPAAWVWRSGQAEVEIIIQEKFEHIYIADINEDGKVILGQAYDSNQNGGNFLWFDGQGVLFTDQLFDTLHLDLGVDDYSFTKISNDGTRLMGYGYIDDQAFALIVTIPDLTP